MTLTELAMVKPGEPVGSIRYGGGGQLIDSEITQGVVPDASTLASADSKVFVTTDSMGNPDVTVGLANIHDGEATLGIEAAGGNTLNNPAFVQKLLTEVMSRSDVKLASLNPRATSIPREALPQIGFQPDEAGEDYTLSLAA